MSQKIDPREVLKYLNELGYTNINAQVLKDFITDLKKLIKHENRRKQKENVELVSPVNANVCQCPVIGTHDINSSASSWVTKGYFCGHPLCPHSQKNTDQEKEDDVFSQLYTHHTVASKETSKRDRHISVHIKKPKNKAEGHEHCIHIYKQEEERRVEQNRNIQMVHNIETASDGSKLYVTTESTIKTVDDSKQSVSTKPCTSKKQSKSSIIRCAPVKSINKSDPVALYHFYQDQWKKQKFPGQENHADLRWSVREKLLGGPQVNIRPKTCRTRCNSWRG